MATNFLDYTGLTFDEIVTQINTKLAQNSNFSNF
jgi:hypothetical protein